MKKRPTRSLPLPRPLACALFEASNRRAFSMPPVASTNSLADTVKRRPLKVATAIFDTVRAAGSVAILTALAYRSTRTLLDALISSRYSLPNLAGGLNCEIVSRTLPPVSGKRLTSREPIKKTQYDGAGGGGPGGGGGGGRRGGGGGAAGPGGRPRGG